MGAKGQRRNEPHAPDCRHCAVARGKHPSDCSHCVRLRAKLYRPCSVEGCTRGTVEMGLCKLHAGRVRRTGNPRPSLPLFPTSEDRFWEKVEGRGTDGCWEWLGYRGKHGHGQFGAGSRLVYAYRFSYGLVNGPIPRGQIIHHVCGNSGCVNPDHLETMTQGQHVKLHREEAVG